MRIISTNCPYCGASLPIDKDKSSFSCNYCGNTFLLDNEVRHIKYDNAEEAGYQFEKGRQRAQIERSQIQAPLTFKQPDSSKNKSKIWLWVLGWIFIFPLPLTIILLKNKSINKVLKYIIIVSAWLAYLAIGLYGMYNDNTNTTSKIEKQNGSDITQSTSDDLSEMSVLYPDDKTINNWLNKYNSLYPESPITEDDYSVYYHHGSYHKNQIKLTIDNFPIVLSSGKAIVTCYENQGTNEDCKNLFCKLVPIYCTDLTQKEIIDRWETVMNDSTNNVIFEDGLDVSFRIYNNKIEMMEIV